MEVRREKSDFVPSDFLAFVPLYLVAEENQTSVTINKMFDSLC